eukprot:CAMPEP_0198653400 /NCGR_PEP_ID=MMETSP1467-20131203/7023_1 /TAXON_ID=1462469 /ORGANISM="unid. sp., Strain CCMP2135" /LENGTH=433 /DNA_ID=CAMNT_0044389361 /DNA_START=80 /DNA_END=1381 /DNA_ORIENTATION=+
MAVETRHVALWRKEQYDPGGDYPDVYYAARAAIGWDNGTSVYSWDGAWHHRASYPLSGVVAYDDRALVVGSPPVVRIVCDENYVGFGDEPVCPINGTTIEARGGPGFGKLVALSGGLLLVAEDEDVLAYDVDWSRAFFEDEGLGPPSRLGVRGASAIAVNREPFRLVAVGYFSQELDDAVVRVERFIRGENHTTLVRFALNARQPPSSLDVFDVGIYMATVVVGGADGTVSTVSVSYSSGCSSIDDCLDFGVWRMHSKKAGNNTRGSARVAMAATRAFVVTTGGDSADLYAINENRSFDDTPIVEWQTHQMGGLSTVVGASRFYGGTSTTLFLVGAPLSDTVIAFTCFESNGYCDHPCSTWWIYTVAITVVFGVLLCIFLAYFCFIYSVVCCFCGETRGSVVYTAVPVTVVRATPVIEAQPQTAPSHYGSLSC